jgi:replicative DNA helicase
VSTKEIQTINSVLKNKDIGVLFGQSVDDLFVSYQDVWQTIKNYHNKYHSIPDVDVIQEQYPDFEEVQVSGETAYYLEGLTKEYVSSRLENILLKAGQSLTPDTSLEILEKLQFHTAKLNRFSNASKDLNVMDFEEAERYYEEVRARAAAMGGTPGIPTGIDFIDSAYTSGFAGGDLIVVLGWTGRAKSLFTTLVCCNAHEVGHKPMIVSLEMSGAKVRDRIFTIKGSGLFNNSALTLGDVDLDDFKEFRQSQEGKSEFVVVTSNGGIVNPNFCQAKIDQHKPSLMVFDYAQLATDNLNTPEMVAKMRNMSNEFKRLAVANDIPVILISSATADNTSDTANAPIVEQVAWSKQLSFDADLAFAVHKLDGDGNMIEIVARKNRNGPLFSGYLDWDIDRGIVKELF